MTTKEINCHVCTRAMKYVDVPKKNLYYCTSCDELGQVLEGGVVSPINTLLEKNRLGDDRVRAALSSPHVATVDSFIEIFDQAIRTMVQTSSVASSEARKVLAMMENRLDTVISRRTEAALVDDVAKEDAKILVEVREMLSTMSRATRGIPGKSKNVDGAEG